MEKMRIDLTLNEKDDKELMEWIASQPHKRATFVRIALYEKFQMYKNGGYMNPNNYNNGYINNHPMMNNPIPQPYIPQQSYNNQQVTENKIEIVEEKKEEKVTSKVKPNQIKKVSDNMKNFFNDDEDE